jgi:hypothetical protein
MARIVVGIGTSHTPMLDVGAGEWPLFEELDRRRPHLHKDGRRATYDELLALASRSLRAELTPDKTARRHGEGAAGALEHLDLRWVRDCPGFRTPAGTGTGMCFASWE